MTTTTPIAGLDDAPTEHAGLIDWVRGRPQGATDV